MANWHTRQKGAQSTDTESYVNLYGVDERAGYSASGSRALDAPVPDVTVIVVNYNTAHLLGQMFAALEASRGSLRFQVIVVDNASRDGSGEILRTKYPDSEL